MKIIKLAIVLFAIVFAISALPARSFAADDKPGRMPERSGPKIAFNFVDVEISTVVKFISEITGNNFLFDERIKGKITIIAPTKLSIDESFTLFTSVLSLKGFTIIPSGPKTYKIIPSSLAKQEGVISPDETLPINEGYITKLITVENLKVDDALQFFRPIISRDGHISSFGPSNMLLVVDSAVNIDKIMSMLKLIDKPSVSAEEATIHVYFLEHADATDLSKVLMGIIKDLQTSLKTGRARPAAGGAPEAAPIVSVTPDKATNSLVIVAPYSEYQDIVRVVKTLDKKRKQVFVEAMIVEASIDKLKDIGSKWRAMATHNGEPIAVGGVGNIGSATLLDIVNGLSGLSIGGMGNFFEVPITSVNSDGSASSTTLTAPGFAALFSLNEFKDAINVLSTPQILTSDNEEAEILVGENVPFIAQRERDVTTATTVLNSITRTDVGIKLQITPQITEGDYVKLDIFQEISSVKSASDNVLISVGPTTTKRSTKTSVVVKDGRTVVIGGLMQERDEDNVFKIPLLGDIPVLGWLFKFKSVSHQKTNLLVFLSPHVIKETPQLTKLTEEKYKEFVEREKYYRKGELLVRFKDDVSEERALEIISQQEATVIKYLEAINVYHIRLKAYRNIEDAINDFSSLPEVLYAEPNYKVKLQSPPVEVDIPGPAPEIDMNKTVPPLHEEKSSAPQPAEIEQPAPAVNDINPPIMEQPAPAVEDNNPPDTLEQPAPAPDDNNSPDTNGKDETLPQSDIDKKKVISADEVNETASVVPDQTPTSPQNIDEKTTGPAADIIETKKEISGSKNYFIQVGAWVNVKLALNTLEILRTHYPDIYMAEEGKFNKVRIPGTMSKEKDTLMIRELKERFNLHPVLVNNKT